MTYFTSHDGKQELNHIHSILKDLFLIPVNYINVLYLHAPFCFKRCSFCAYSAVVPVDPEEIKYFYECVLPGQIEFYSDALKAVPFQQVFFGGGTPNLISGIMLDELFAGIPGFEQIPQKMIEVSPGTLTEEHIKVLSKWKFTLVSMGVQTLDEAVLKKNNRSFVGIERLHTLCSHLNDADILTSIDLLALINHGDISDLDQVRDDLDQAMSYIYPVEIVLHINYRQELPVSLLQAIIDLIREMTVKYPAYRCVNSLLAEEDAQEYHSKYPAFRLMRENPSYTFYMQPLVPRPGTYGHNMLALGQYKGISLISDYLDHSFYLSQKRYKVRTSDSDPRYFDKKKQDFLQYQKIRRQLGLQYPEIAEEPFVNESDYKEYKKIIQKLADYL